MSSAPPEWKWDQARRMYYYYIAESRTFVFQNGEQVVYNPAGGITAESDPRYVPGVTTTTYGAQQSTTTTPVSPATSQNQAYVHAPGRAQPSVSPQPVAPSQYAQPGQQPRTAYGQSPRESQTGVSGYTQPQSGSTYGSGYAPQSSSTTSQSYPYAQQPAYSQTGQAAYGQTGQAAYGQTGQAAYSQTGRAGYTQGSYQQPPTSTYSQTGRSDYGRDSEGQPWDSTSRRPYDNRREEDSSSESDPHRRRHRSRSRERDKHVRRRR